MSAWCALAGHQQWQAPFQVRSAVPDLCPREAGEAVKHLHPQKGRPRRSQCEAVLAACLTC